MFLLAKLIPSKVQEPLKIMIVFFRVFARLSQRTSSNEFEGLNGDCL